MRPEAKRQARIRRHRRIRRKVSGTPTPYKVLRNTGWPWLLQPRVT